jgi:hemerythrin
MPLKFDMRMPISTVSVTARQERATMPLLTWDQCYSVKIAELDGHHQKLFYLLNCLHEAMREGKGKSVIREIVEELVSYTHIHFQREEVLMEQANFPGLEVHRLEHQKLMASVGEFKDALDSGRGVNTTTVVEFLRGWLTKHICGMDQSYSSHLNAKGIH